MISSFYIQLYKIVDDRSSDPIISWSKSSPNIFVVWDLKKLRRDILTKSSVGVLLGRNLTEFIAKLRSHGFRSVLKGFGELEFEHDDFTRGLVTKKTKMVKALSERFDAQIKAIKCRFKAKKASSSLKVEHLFP
ncbi:heat stress transcription factor A-4a-like [Brassica napus]|uniref:heat stress transcription factor A-4a-like n=1 Tax=Brassica napus TaxID=3708 RepID=UPI0006AAEDAB|nr:heat stress transcription factor A-4a-like [Brassica napus]